MMMKMIICDKKAGDDNENVYDSIRLCAGVVHVAVMFIGIVITD